MDELKQLEHALDAARRSLRSAEIGLDQVSGEINAAQLALQMYREAIATRAMYIDVQATEPTPPRPHGLPS